MGASEWISFAPFHERINDVLNSQRQKEFDAHKYYDFVDLRLDQLKTMEYSEFEQDVMHVMNPRYSVSHEDFERLKSLSGVEIIEDLVLIQGDGGTHSIIDIDGISTESGYRMAIQLNESQLLHVFGTIFPSREDVDKNYHALSQFIIDWMAVYFIVYEDQTPAEICFYGITGD